MEKYRENNILKGYNAPKAQIYRLPAAFYHRIEASNFYFRLGTDEDISRIFKRAVKRDIFYSLWKP